VGGAALTARLCALDEKGETGPLEVVAAWAIVTLFLWTSVNWVLAPLRGIRPAALLSFAALAAATGVPTLRRELSPGGGIRRGVRALFGPGMGPWSWLLVLAPLSCWLVFAAWRGSFTPIMNHDALSYHLPRAVDIARSSTWRYLPVQDYRLASFPSSYEMLLADVILLSGDDQATSLVGILTYGAGIAMAAAMGERRWGTGTLAWFTALVWAGTPLALLHSVGHKNDLLFFVETAGAAMWGARWAARGGVFPLWLATVSTALAVGAKIFGFALLPAALVSLGPFGLWARGRAALRKPRALVGWIAAVLALLVLGGLAPYVADAVHLHDPPFPLFPGDPAAYRLNMVPHYGAWGNIPKFFASMLMAPFSWSSRVLWMPWLDAYSFWPRYEIYFSNYGALVAVFAMLIPCVLVTSRTSPFGEVKRREARAATAFLLTVTALTLPVSYHVEGYFNGMGRYLLFLPILAVEWGPARWIVAQAAKVAGDVRDGVMLDRIGARLGRVPLFVAAAFFAYSAVDNALHDSFAPYPYLRSLREYPRRDLAFKDLHASQKLDQRAGPGDRVLVDGGFGAWIHPAFGAKLTRPLEYLSPVESERAGQIERADWVLVDHYFGVVWGGEKLTDMSKAGYIDTGDADPRELVFAERMLQDPRFEIAYEEARRHQIVLHRRGAPRRP
jgi:hypothetical protein